MRIKTILNKLAAWSISAFMVFNQCGLDAFATGTDDGSNTGNNPTQSVAERNPDADPIITIQHYLNFSEQTLTNLPDEFKTETDGDYFAEASQNILIPWVSNKLAVWNTNFRNGTLPTNLTNTGIDYKLKREMDPHYSFDVIDAGGGKYELKTEKKLYKMFKDDTTNYLKKPQIRHMNKLYNSKNENAYNPNYTLKEIWLTKKTETQDDSNSIQQADFDIVPVPTLEIDGVQRHDPSKILFTNDINNKQLASAVKKSTKDGITWGETADGKIIIHVSEGLVIRLVFEPTEGTQEVGTVDFFDYDITDGWIYTTEASAKQALNCYVAGTDNTVPIITKEQIETLKSNGGNFIRNSSGVIEGMRIPSEMQSLINSNETLYVATWHQGINSLAGNNTLAENYLAFGNDNARTGLGNLPWSNDSGNSNYSITPNKTYGTNRIGLNLWGANYTEGVNLKGATFGLANSMNSDSNAGNLIWNINSPAIFSKTPLTGKTVYPQGENGFKLGFNRLGGTYTLDTVSYNGGNPTGNYSQFEKTEVTKSLHGITKTQILYANRFWPMDLVEQDSTTIKGGNDIRFGSRTDSDKRVAVGLKDIDLNTNSGQPDGGIAPKNSDWDSGKLPESDFDGDHNPYFGMKVQLPFVMENGYSAPLRYFFYGDDDMIVFLSKASFDENGNVDVNSIDPASTVKIADIGGVHSSMGMYVDVWDFIEEKKEISGLKDTYGTNIYYYDNNALQNSDDASKVVYENVDGKQVDTRPKSQAYVMTVYYTERGASGSSCFMRYSLPFEELSVDEITMQGEIQVSKDIKRASGNSSIKDDYRYVFELELTEPGGTPFLNTYPVEFIKDGKPCATNHVKLIGDHYLFTLDDNETMHITGLPTLGPVEEGQDPRGYHYKVTEIGIYKPDEVNPDYVAPGGTLNPSAERQENIKEHTFPLSESDETTTFQYGKINATSEEDGQYREPQIGLSFENIISNFNKVKFINAENPAVLNIKKLTTADQPEDEFEFKIKLTGTDGQSLQEVPYFLNGKEVMNESGTPPLPVALAPNPEDGLFHIRMKKNDTYTLYNLPKGVKYEIVESPSDQYVVENIQVSGDYVEITNKDQGIVNGTINGPIDTTPEATVTYTNKLTPNTKVSIPVSKTLTGREVNENDEFKFEISAAGDEQTSTYTDSKAKLDELESTIVSIRAEQDADTKTYVFKNASFGPLIFTEADNNKTFDFTIKELNTDPLKQITYDASTYTVSMNVRMDGNKVVVDETWTKDGEPLAGDADKVAAFTNEFIPEAIVPTNFKKKIHGTSVAGNEFVFTLEALASKTPDNQDIPVADVPMPEKNAVTLAAAGTENETLEGTFGDIKFTKPGTYKYVIRETNPNLDHVVQVVGEVGFTVTVTKDPDSDNLTSEVEYNNDPNTTEIVLVNTYQSTELVIPVLKTLDGRNMKESDVFTFDLYEEGDLDKPIQTLTLDSTSISELNLNSMSGQFLPITLNEVKTYNYVIKERKLNDPQIEYDATPVELSVKVIEDSDTKQLRIESTDYVKDNLKNEGNASFTNKVKSETTWAPTTVNKQAIGVSPANFPFEMSIAAKDGTNIDVVKNPQAQSVTSAADGTVTFTPFVFTDEGEFTVTVNEGTLNDATINADTHSVTYDLNVLRDPNTGELSVKGSGNNAAPVPNGSEVFTNDKGIQIYKNLQSGTGENGAITDADRSVEFKFKASITDTAGNLLTGLDLDLYKVDRNIYETGKMDGAVSQKFTNGTEFTLKSTQVAVIKNAPYNSQYIIEEIESAQPGFVLTSTAGTTGTVNEDAVSVFTNLKKGTVKGQIQAYKELSGFDGYLNAPETLKDLSQFSFTISAAGEALVEPLSLENEDKDKDENNEGDEGSKEEDPEGEQNNSNQDGTDNSSSEPVITDPNGSDQTQGEITQNPAVNPDTDPVVESEQSEDPGNTEGASPEQAQNGNPEEQPQTDATNQSLRRIKNLNKKEVLPADKVPLPNPATVNASATGEIIFGSIEFTQAGTYNYQIVENNDGNDNYQYDSNKVNVAVDVVEDKDEKGNVTGYSIKSITYTYPGGSTSETPYTFHNEYIGKPALELTKTQSLNETNNFITDPLKAIAQDTVTYRITASVPATATAAAKNVVITDKIPYEAVSGDKKARLALVQDSWGDGKLDAANETITWEVGSIAPGTSVTRSFTMKVPEVSTITKWSNAANAQYNNPPTGDDGTRDTPPVDVETQPAKPTVEIVKAQAIKLSDNDSFGSFSKEADSAEKAPGLSKKDRVRYELIVTNTGTATAHNVIVTDKVPVSDGKSLTFIQALNNGEYDKDISTITWNVGELGPKASRYLYFDVEVPQVKQATVWENIGHLTYQDPENPDNQIPKDTNKVFVKTDIPDLSIEKTQSIDEKTFVTYKDPALQAKTYDVVTYNLKVTNTDKAEAHDVVVKDPIPVTPVEPKDSKAELSYISGSAVVVKTDGTKVQLGQNVEGTVIWNLGTLKPGEEVNVQFKVKVPKVETFTKWKNVASVTYSNNPNNPEDPDEPYEEIPTKEVFVETDAPKVTILKQQAKVEKTSGKQSDFTTDLLSVESGDTIIYQITAENTGTGTAEGVVITDTYPVPEGLILIEDSLKADGGKLSADKKTITWNAFDLEQGAKKTVSFKVQVPKVTSYQKWTNVASLTYENNPDNPEDPKEPKKEVPSDPVDSETNVPEVIIKKSQDKNHSGKFQETILDVEANDTITYKLTLTNTGKAVAKSVLVKDEIPAGLTYVDETLNPAGEIKGNLISVNVGDIEAGQSKEVTFDVRVPAVKKLTRWRNIGTVSYPNNPKNPDDPEDPDKPDVEEPSNPVESESDVPNLIIEKLQAKNDEELTKDMLPVIGDDIVTYQINIKNTGKAVAKTPTIKDSIPVGLTLVEGSISNGGSVDENGVITWTLADLSPEQTGSVTFKVKVPFTEKAALYRNGSSVSYPNNPENQPGQPDKDIPSNDVYIYTPESGGPKLSIHKNQSVNGSTPTEAKLNASSGDIVTYNLTVTNISSKAAGNVVVKDVIPEGLVFVKDSINESGVLNGNEITWKFERLEPGEYKTVSFKAQIPQVKKATTWKNVGVVTYNDPEDPDKPFDPEPSNEVEVETKLPAIQVEKLQALNGEAPKKDKITDAKAEDVITYFVRVTSTGEADAKSVKLTDVIPEGLIFVEGSISDQGILNGNIVEWDLGDLKPGVSVMRSFKVKVPEVKEASTWVNVASATYPNNPNNPDDPDEPDTPEPSNPVESESNVPHLNIEKEQSVNDGEFTKKILSVNPEDTVTYKLIITNDSDATAKDVTLTDRIPEGLQLIADSISDQGSQKDGLITWKLGDIAAKESRSVTFKVKVPSVSEKSSWTNVAKVSYPNNPDNPKDPEDPTKPGGPDKEDPSNEVTIEVPVDKPNVILRKTQIRNQGKATTSKLSVKDGDIITYVLTAYSKGTVAAENVRIEDVIPEGLTYVEGSISEGGIIEGNKLSWFKEILEPGESFEVTFKVKVPAVSKDTSWKNIAIVTYSNDPEGETPHPSNEVEIEEPVIPANPKYPPRRPGSSYNGSPTKARPSKTAASTHPILWTGLAMVGLAAAAGLYTSNSKRRDKKSK